MDKKLEGRVAIITGAASGLGEASSRLFVENAARLVMTDINADRGHALAQEIGARFIETDVSDPAAVDCLVSDTVEREGGWT